MRVLICGGRDWKDRGAIFNYLKQFPRDTTVIEGGQKGADTLARYAGFDLGFDVITFWANWRRWRNAAGPRRNGRMLREGKPDRIGAFPTAQSKGTYDMIERAENAGIPVDVWPFEEQGDEQEET